MGRTKGDAHHQHRKNKVKKRCLRAGCGRIFWDITSLTVKPVDPDKPQPGICPKCKKSDEDYISEDDLHGQDMGGVE